MKSYITLLFFLICLVSCFSNNSNESNSNWSIEYYLDEFQEQTDEPYIIGDFKGSFSNSATTNSVLNVQVLIDSTRVRFKFFEYGTHLLKDAGSFKFRYKTQDGATGEIGFLSNDPYGYIGNYNAFLYEYEINTKLRELFINNSIIKFSCNNTEYYSDEYNFEINTKGLNEALKKANIPLKMPPYPGQ